MTDFAAEARRLDAEDPLADRRDQFLPYGEDLVAYLDGNSLGRPTADLPGRLDDFVRQSWGNRLIRGWSDEWMDWPVVLGDVLADACLGAGPGQTIVADSTSVLLYKLARAALTLRTPERREIVLDVDNFPTDRYLVQGIAEELGLRIRWIETDPGLGVTPEQVEQAVGEETALFLASHVAYRSGYLAEAALVTELVHRAGAPVLWDLSHSVGVVPLALDEWQVDFAVGCGYKYLNGGPGAPAFGYVAARHHGRARQPLQGWMGHAEPFTMGPDYRAAEGIRGYLTGTPPILAMVSLRASIDMINSVGIELVRRKSLALTDFALTVIDAELVPLGVRLLSPRDHDHRGGHLTIARADFAEVNQRLWERGVIPDFRRPDGIRLGLSPLTTSFAEVERALAVIREVLLADAG